MNRRTATATALASVPLAAAAVLGAQAPAAAKVNNVFHSNWSGTYGDLKVICEGGAIHWLPPGNNSPCWDTWGVSSFEYNGAKCYINGAWVSSKDGTFQIQNGVERNCRSYGPAYSKPAPKTQTASEAPVIDPQAAYVLVG